MSDNDTVIVGTSVALGPASDLVSFPSYIVNGTATFINRGAAADIWLVETPNSKYILKTLRLSLDCFPTSQGRVQGDESSVQQNDRAQQFIKDFRFKAAQWANLQHQNLVKVFGLGERLDLRVEYCENSTARQYLEKHNGDQLKKLSMIKDILKGIIYLHAHDPPIVHASLKMDKIFVAADGTAKIGEFGLSAMTRSFALLAPSISQAGLSRWMSPELVNVDPDVGAFIPTTSSDIWALGCTFMEILSGEIPYRQYKHELRVRRAIIQGEKPWPIPGAGEEPFAMWPVLEWCWKASPGSRPSVRAVGWVIQGLCDSIASSSIAGRIASEVPVSIITSFQPLSPPVEAYASLPDVAEHPAAPSLPERSRLIPPKLPPSTWQIFFTEYLRNLRDENPSRKFLISQVAKEAGITYKALTLEQKEPYKRKAIEAKEEYERKRSEWAKTRTPDDIRAESALRTAQRGAGKSRRFNLRDPNAPKKPLSAYFLFLQWIRADQARVDEVFGGETETTRQSVLAAAKWRTLSDSEKKPFLEQAEHEKVNYEAARKEYEDRTPPALNVHTLPPRISLPDLGGPITVNRKRERGTFDGPAFGAQKGATRSKSPGLPPSLIPGDLWSSSQVSPFHNQWDIDDIPPVSPTGDSFERLYESSDIGSMLFNDYDWDIGDQSFQSSNAFGTGSDYMPPNPWDTPNSQPTNPSFEFGTFQLPSTVGDESAIFISSAQGDTTPPTVPAGHFTFNIDDLPFVAPDLLHRI